MKRLLPLLAVLASLLVPAAPAVGAEKLSEAEKKEFALNLALPSPAEMFLAIDRLGDAEWRSVINSSDRYDYGDNYARALNLGVRAADGLVAILAEDKARLGDAITVIITLAEELMVQDTILERSSTFEQLANEGRWDELRDELDALRYLIEMEMDQLGDQDIATLVRAGGWLRGLSATASLLEGQGYDAHITSILYQPTLVDYFRTELSTLDEKARAHPLVAKLAAALPDIRTLVNVGYATAVPDANIKKLRALSAKLVEDIEGGAS